MNKKKSQRSLLRDEDFEVSSMKSGDQVKIKDSPIVQEKPKDRFVRQKNFRKEKKTSGNGRDTSELRESTLSLPSD